MSARKTTVPIPSAASPTTSFHGFCRRALGIIEESSSLGDAFKAERSGRARLPNSRKGSRREMTLRWYTSHNTGKLPSRRWRNPRLGGSRDVARSVISLDASLLFIQEPRPTNILSRLSLHLGYNQLG